MIPTTACLRKCLKAEDSQLNTSWSTCRPADPKEPIQTNLLLPDLFLQEKANEHEEPLLFAQYALQQLAFIVEADAATPPILMLVAKWLHTLLKVDQPLFLILRNTSGLPKGIIPARTSKLAIAYVT